MQNLLVLARIRSRTLELHVHAVALAPLIEQVTRAVMSASPENSVRTDFGAEPHVHADGERLALALRNLLDEAFHLCAPAAPVTVLLGEQARDVAIGVRHRCGPSVGQAWDAAAEPDELGIRRVVTEAIIAAHGGELRNEAEALEATAWIRLPAIEARG